MEKVNIVCMSDTHSQHDKFEVPPGDIFIHAGDFTTMGSIQDIAEFNLFLKKLPHTHKIIIAGNHDWGFQTRPEEAKSALLEGLTNCYYLQDEALSIYGINFYGSPWQPKFCRWAFNLARGKELKEKWDMIPANTDILITHGPPYGILDKTSNCEFVGCVDLLEAVERIKPRYHIFGHVHEGRGMKKFGETEFINASNLTVRYKPLNPVITFEYKLKT